jgi:hydroxyacylglutathione hydrolase
MDRRLICTFLLLLVLAPALLAGGQDKTLPEAWERLPAADRLFQQGLKEFRLGRSDAAAAAFEKCLAELPQHAYARYYLANIIYIRNEFERALEHTNRAVADLDFMQALSDYAVKQKNKTYESYTRMMAEEWDSTTSCRAHREIESLYGEITDAKGRRELQLAGQKAAQARQKAHYLYFLGNIHFQLRRYDEAARKYREAIELNPQHANAYNNAAAISYLAGDNAGALDYLERAERQGLGDNLNLMLQYLVYEALGRPTEGILREDLQAGAPADVSLVRFALAFKSRDALAPPLYENAYVIFSRASREAVLIDPGVEDPRIGDLVRAQNLTVKAILNTHGHEDHVSADAAYAGLFRAPILIAAQDARRLPAAPAGTVFDGEILRYDGFTIKVLLTPGHTPGSVCFLAGDFLISGDTLFKNGIGLVASGSPAKTAKIQEAMVRSIKDKVLTLPDATRLCPGHGKTSTIADEKADNPFLKR